MNQLGKVKASPAFKTPEARLHRDLPENAAQLVKVHRLGKMEIEPSLSAAFNVGTRGKARECYGFDGALSFRLSNNVVTITVWQPNITKHNVKLFGVDHVQRATGVMRGGNFMAEM